MFAFSAGGGKALVRERSGGRLVGVDDGGGRWGVPCVCCAEGCLLDVVASMGGTVERELGWNGNLLTTRWYRGVLSFHLDVVVDGETFRDLVGQGIRGL